MRVRELEMLRKQVDTMQQYKQNWMEKQQQLQKTISELERHSQMEHERLESELVLQTETAELALLDKQVAEEKVRSELAVLHSAAGVLQEASSSHPPFSLPHNNSTGARLGGAS